MIKNKKKFNVGIIGLGVGNQHFLAYQKHPDCIVKSVCDFDKNIQAEFAKGHSNIYFAKDSNEILYDPSIDIVTIASWDNYHYEQIIKGIKNNKHLFVEKPLCIYEKEAKHINDLLNKNNSIKISSNLILRKSPRFREMKRIIDDKLLGDIFAIEGDYNYGRSWKISEGWRGKVEGYSGVYGGGVHIIDLFSWLVGEKIEEVFSYGNNISLSKSGYKKNDYIVSILKFKNGMNGKFSVNLGCVYPHFHRLSVYGTKGTLENDHRFAKHFTKPDPHLDYEVLNSDYPGVDKGDLIDNFIFSIQNDIEPHVGKKEIFDTMSACFAIEKSLSTGTPEKVNYFS